jgi:hypothetical protein
MNIKRLAAAQLVQKRKTESKNSLNRTDGIAQRADNGQRSMVPRNAA